MKVFIEIPLILSLVEEKNHLRSMKESKVTTYASSCPLQYLVASQLCENHRTDPDQEFLLPEATIFDKLKI